MGRCHSNTYLGSSFTSYGKVSHSVNGNAHSKLPHVPKFVSSVDKKNNDVYFTVKRRTFETV